MEHPTATTPQLKAVNRLFETYCTCDITKAADLFSKDYTYSSFPKIAELPDQTREEHFKLFAPMFAKLIKVEVRTLHRGTAFELPG
jgi:hypothetical protein